MKAQILLSVFASVLFPLTGPVAAFAGDSGADSPVGAFVHQHPSQHISQFAPPRRGRCGPSIKVTTLAVESQYGAGSAQNATMLEFRLGADDTGKWIVAMGGGSDAVVPGKVFNLPTGPNQHCNKKLSLRTTVAVPNMDAPTIMQKEEHKNPLAVLMFENGDLVADKIAEAGVEAPYGNQQSLAQILAPYTNAAGKIVLPSGQRIMAFEFGSLANIGGEQGDQVNEAVDFNDAVLKVDYKNVIPQEIALRKSAGQSSAVTNGNKGFATGVGISGWTSISMPFDAQSDVKLTNLRAVMVQLTTGAPVYSAYDYRLNLWSSKAAFISSPQLGDLASHVIDAPTTGPTPWGISGFILPFTGIKPTNIFTFDLKPLNIVAPAGSDRRIGLQVLGVSSFSGDIGLMESTENGVPDCRIGATTPAGVCWDLDVNNQSFHDGRMAIDLSGIAQ